MASYYKNKIRSIWREYAFMLHQVQRAIKPKLTLINTIDNWHQIANWLAEPRRKRECFEEAYWLALMVSGLDPFPECFQQ